MYQPSTTPAATTSACSVSYPSYVGDGHCDTTGEYNTISCGWDGGDCCEDSCISSDSYTCGTNSYDCKDPEFSTCSVDGSSFLGDGYCDSVGGYNTAVCGWDGGDCCSSSCEDSAEYTCGEYGYTCLDPDSSDSASVCEVGFNSWLADGYCDASGDYNTQACDWDGGDCCASTCGFNITATTFDCDESADAQVCLDPTAAEYVPAECAVAQETFIGDGFCDGFGYGNYNTLACDWDGGDCCASTCIDGADHTCSDDANHYECLDPDASDHAPGNCTVLFPEYLGDAYCDYSGGYNVAACGWDGGDCCYLTCQEPANADESTHTCGEGGYDCKDQSTCTVDYPSWLADGYCDGADHNTELCNWDGGDCCATTCVETQQYDCSSATVATCLDPDASSAGSTTTITPPPTASTAMGPTVSTATTTAGPTVSSTSTTGVAYDTPEGTRSVSVSLHVQYSATTDYSATVVLVEEYFATQGLDTVTVLTRVDQNPDTGQAQVTVAFVPSGMTTLDTIREAIVEALASVSSTTTTTLPTPPPLPTRTSTSISFSTAASTTTTSLNDVNNNNDNGDLFGDAETIDIVIGVVVAVVILVIIAVVVVVVSKGKAKRAVKRRSSSHIATPTGRANTYLRSIQKDADEGIGRTDAISV